MDIGTTLKAFAVFAYFQDPGVRGRYEAAGG